MTYSTLRLERRGPAAWIWMSRPEVHNAFERCRLNTGDGAPFAIPGLCLVAGRGIAAQNRLLASGTGASAIVRIVAPSRIVSGRIRHLAKERNP
jgi:hypothetical protein